MNRITIFKLAGKEYPLNFSVKAAKIVDEKYGGIEKFADSFDGNSIGKMMGVLSELLHILMEQGAAYERFVNEKEIEIPTLDEFETVLGMQDFSDIQTTLFDAMGLGSTTTVEVEPDRKNAKTTQGN